MNPFAGLSTEWAGLIAIYSFTGMILFAVLGLWAIDRARNAPAAIAPAIASRPFAWVRCPSGHCKVNADRDWSCPACGARLA